MSLRAEAHLAPGGAPVRAASDSPRHSVSVATHRRQPRGRHAWVTAGSAPRTPWWAFPLVISLLMTGCASSASNGSPIAASAAAKAVESATGFTLSRNYLTSAGRSTRGLAMSYVGGELRESVLVIVFDEAEETRQFLGGARASSLKEPTPARRASSIIRVENVVVLYSREVEARDRERGIRHELDRAMTEREAR